MDQPRIYMSRPASVIVWRADLQTFDAPSLLDGGMRQRAKYFLLEWVTIYKLQTEIVVLITHSSFFLVINYIKSLFVKFAPFLHLILQRRLWLPPTFQQFNIKRFLTVLFLARRRQWKKMADSVIDSYCE